MAAQNEALGQLHAALRAYELVYSATREETVLAWGAANDATMARFSAVRRASDETLKREFGEMYTTRDTEFSEMMARPNHSVSVLQRRTAFRRMMRRRTTFTRTMRRRAAFTRITMRRRAAFRHITRRQNAQFREIRARALVRMARAEADARTELEAASTKRDTALDAAAARWNARYSAIVVQLDEIADAITKPSYLSVFVAAI